MKPLVIYHDKCADGFGAAFAAWTVLGGEAEYVAAQYGKPLVFRDEFLAGRDIYILDFSFQREVMGVLFQVAKRVIWLDHHKTAFEMWCPGEYVAWMSDPINNKHHIRLDNNKSGAMLAWEYFHPGTEVPMLIKHIDDYDRWQFKLEGTKEFNKALWSYAPWSFEQWNELYTRENYPETEAGSIATFKQEGAAILRAHDANVKAVVEGSARICNIRVNVLHDPDVIHETATLTGLVANCPPHLASDVGHQLANESGTYGLLWHINKDGKCLCSIRSNGDYDVSAIAKAFGGGGHKNAAGFEIDVQTLLGWIK